MRHSDLDDVRVLLRNPTREIEVAGPVTVAVLLERLNLDREAHLVIENGELVPSDKMLLTDAMIEIRSVISGGSERFVERGDAS